MVRDRRSALLRVSQTLYLGTFLSVLGAARPAASQANPRLDLGGTIEVGGERERYLRVLQIAGLVPLVPWSIQPFSPTEMRALQPRGAHPWRDRFDTAAQSPGGRDGVHILRPSVRVIENSAFPVQVGVGPTWAGRGVTAEGQAGVSAAWNALSAQIAPLAFIAQNASFPLAPNGLTDDRRFADPRFPLNIDAPQRFGTASYGRVSAGTSSLTLDTHSLIVSLSSAPSRWGPAREYPLVLGPDAGGFPSIHAGTSDPVNLLLFRAHVRAVYGQIGQSAFATPTTDDGRRLGSGVIVVALPRGIDGLELGVARFIHRPWEGASSVNTLLRPFSGFISNNGSTLNQGFENQMGSVFARWALPAAKAEFYGEMYKEDYPGAFHAAASSLIEKPDDLAAFTFGFQRAFVSSDHTIRVLRGELVNGETSHQERGQRGFVVPVPPYIHSGGEVQGHTSNGLILGSPEAYGGAGWRLGVDEYSPNGRRSIGLERSLRFDWLPTLAPGAPVHPDVTYAFRAELIRFRGVREYGVTLIPAIDLNRNLVVHNDVFNLTAAITVRGWNW